MTELIEKCLELGVPQYAIPALQVVEDFYDALLTEENHHYNQNVEYHRHLVMGMVAGYTIKYDPKEFGEVLSEQDYTIPVGDITLKVKIDGQVKKGDKWWIHERKTTSSYTKERFLERILMDYQPTGYMYAMKRLGKDVVGVLYDVVKKPRFNKWALETEEQHRMRIVRTFIKDARKEDSQYYYREEIYRSPADLQEFEESIMSEAGDIRLHKASAVWPKDTHRCLDYGDKCAFLPLCKEADEEIQKAMMQVGYDKRRKG